LPNDIRELLVSQATNMLDRHETVQLRQQIEMFVEKQQAQIKD
jgi:hypothetical protein